MFLCAVPYGMLRGWDGLKMLAEHVAGVDLLGGPIGFTTCTLRSANFILQSRPSRGGIAIVNGLIENGLLSRKCNGT